MRYWWNPEEVGREAVEAFPLCGTMFSSLPCRKGSKDIPSGGNKQRQDIEKNMIKHGVI